MGEGCKLSDDSGGSLYPLSYLSTSSRKLTYLTNHILSPYKAD